jgi:hypothetical protein
VVLCTSQFTLTVRRDGQEVKATVTIAASYRNRIRRLGNSPVAWTEHVAMALRAHRNPSPESTKNPGGSDDEQNR